MRRLPECGAYQKVAPHKEWRHTKPAHHKEEAPAWRLFFAAPSDSANH